MMKYLLCLVALSFASPVFSQQDSLPRPHSHRNQFYFYWGYNRDYFSRSSIHFRGPNYDFTLYDLKATDRPERFGWVYVNPGLFSIPQFNWRAGYFITDRLHVSIGMDHMKYVIVSEQPTRISGIVSTAASIKYAGSYLNQNIDLQPEILKFEHTNGFNLATMEFEWLQPLYRLSHGIPKLACYWNAGVGGIWVVTKTDVLVFGDGLDNDFHVAGYAMTGKMGPRLEWKKHWFVTAEGKFGYANLPSVFIKNGAPERADHSLTFFEWYVSVGFRFGKTKSR